MSLCLTAQLLLIVMVTIYHDDDGDDGDGDGHGDEHDDDERDDDGCGHHHHHHHGDSDDCMPLDFLNADPDSSKFKHRERVAGKLDKPRHQNSGKMRRISTVFKGIVCFPPRSMSPCSYSLSFHARLEAIGHPACICGLEAQLAIIDELCVEVLTLWCCVYVGLEHGLRQDVFDPFKTSWDAIVHRLPLVV